MKLLLVFFATAALAASSVINRKHVDLMDDSTIIIRDDHGKLITICKENGKKDIEIEVTGPNTVTKKIQIDENNHVFVKSGDEYQIPISLDDIKNFEDERSKRSFSFRRRNEALDTMLNDDEFNDAPLWNTVASESEILGRRFGDSDSTMPTLLDKVALDATLEKSHRMMYPRWNDIKRMSWIDTNEESDTQIKKVMMIKILMRMIDEQVMMQMLNQFGQNEKLNEIILDNILSKPDIFDRKVVRELLEIPFLRHIMIRQRIFDRSALEMAMKDRFTRGVLDQLINKENLKRWMVSLGCCDRDILRQMILVTIVEDLMATERTDREWLMQVLNDSMLRKMLVQQGIFNEDITEKCLYNLKTNTMYGEDLLRQLINKRILKNHLIQRGFFDFDMLDQMMRNEVLGLKVLLKVLTLDQTPKMTYRQVIGMMNKRPEWSMHQIRTVPLGDDLVGVTMRKTILEPVMNIDDQLDINRDQSTTTSGIWNLFSKLGHGLSRHRMRGY